MNCACEASDSGIPVGLCAAHQLIVDQCVAAEIDRAAKIAETSAFGDHETGAKVVAWSDAQARSRRLGHLIAEAIRTSPQHVKNVREL